MDGPGTVTWEEFLENAERFLVVSDEISDGWQFHGDKVHRVPSSRSLAQITRKPERMHKICKSNHPINIVNEIHNYAIYSSAVYRNRTKRKAL